MMQWWNNVTVRAFRERAQCIVDQYSRYKLPDITSAINGRMTQGENIADNGGLKQSFRVGQQGCPLPLLSALSRTLLSPNPPNQILLPEVHR